MPLAVVCTEPGRLQNGMLRVGIPVAVGVGELVAEGEALAIGVWVGVDSPLQPSSKARTARTSSATPTVPSARLSIASQTDSGCLPRAMFTPFTSSSTLTLPSPLQSPAQRGRT